jgi:hypothetical protein
MIPLLLILTGIGLMVAGVHQVDEDRMLTAGLLVVLASILISAAVIS